MVCASKYAVTTHERWVRPPSSLTMVGSAVATIVESSAASSITSNNPPKITSTLSWETLDGNSTEAMACIATKKHKVFRKTSCKSCESCNPVKGLAVSAGVLQDFQDYKKSYWRS